MNNAAKIGSVTGKIILALVIAFVISVLFTGGILIYLVLSGVIEITELDDSMAMDPVLTTVFTIIQSLGFIVATIVVYTLFERRQSWPLGWRGPGRMVETVRGMLLGILMISLVFVIIWMLGGLHIVAIQWDTSLAGSLALFVLLFVSVAVSEELFSRGYVQGLIKHQFGIVPALLGSSLLFTFLHAFNPGIFSHPLPVVNLFLAGMLFGISRHVSGSLWMPIGFHFTWNLLQGSLFGFPVSGMEVESMIVLDTIGSDVISGGSFGAEGSIAATVVLLVGTSLIYRLYPTRTKGKTR